MADFRRPVFDGQGYDSWKKRLALFLRMRKCNLNVERARTQSDKDSWDENNLKAMNYNCNSVSDIQV